MKLISWNVNGLRAVLKKDFMTIFNELDADWFCLQETKMQAGQVTLDLPGYYQYFNYAERKGYSGTAIFTKHKPLNVTYGMGIPEHDKEGRIITLEYPKFYLMTVYTPNSGGELKRLDYRQQWDKDFRDYTNQLAAKKPLVCCGDLNVAHEPIDLKNDKTNHHNAGFTDEERADFTKQLKSGFIDTFRYLYPDTVTYSWWSYRFHARANNAGWRIDYFVASSNFQPYVKDAKILTDIMGSDHCPVELTTQDLL
ncbi:exodeoxyribonuclease III [Lacticaseibacillus casei]|uniref:exodeoxyribonuclease III n=1 Tax=Lacticaseibacillus casei TaxID=1582 RepID=UPI001108602C|nr:exodeoxyribonuclease III [Lacticaseibacillus casei]TLQ50945.1 exodeoxyribonuclease III [Lacticaseibacillus casei]